MYFIYDSERKTSTYNASSSNSLKKNNNKTNSLLIKLQDISFVVLIAYYLANTFVVISVIQMLWI